MISLSPTCQQTVLQLANSSNPVYQCLQVNSLIPALTTNTSIIPPVDDYLSAVCYNDPCNSTIVNATANSVIESCSTDLANFGIDNGTVSLIFGLYPLARDVVCLKNNETEFLTNATIPLNSTSYNSTNGTFCLTELATNITGYLGVNLTNSYIDTLVLGGNYTALQALGSIPPTALCSDCIFAAVDLIEQQYPLAGDLIVSRPSNLTINGYLNNTCQATGLNVTESALPYGIVDSAKNGTDTTTVYPSFTAVPFGLGNSTAAASATGSAAVGLSSIASAAATGSAASAIAQLTSRAATAASAATVATSSAAALVGRMAEKKRWIGQQ